MRAIYILQTYGYHRCPEFGTLEEAREALRSLVQEEKRRCRARFKSAFVHRHGDSVRVTIGRDFQSALWSSHSIVKA